MEITDYGYEVTFKCECGYACKAWDKYVTLNMANEHLLKVCVLPEVTTKNQYTTAAIPNLYKGFYELDEEKKKEVLRSLTNQANNCLKFYLGENVTTTGQPERIWSTWQILQFAAGYADA